MAQAGLKLSREPLKDDLELLVFLALPPKSWDYRIYLDISIYHMHLRDVGAQTQGFVYARQTPPTHLHLQPNSLNPNNSMRRLIFSL